MHEVWTPEYSMPVCPLLRVSTSKGYMPIRWSDLEIVDIVRVLESFHLEISATTIYSSSSSGISSEMYELQT